jgi:methionyl-tRNA formyltransferase
MNKNIAIFGCKTTTKYLIENLIPDVTVKYLITIDSVNAKKNEVADYLDLSDWAKEMGIDVYSVKHYGLKNATDIEYINSLKLDIIFVAGWQRLIPESILNKLSVGAFGMHGSSMNLPLGRGRSPMNWSILEGRKVFYTNLFKYDNGVDSGDVVDTFKFQITDRDTAETLHFKNTLAMKTLVLRNADALINNNLKLKKQPSLLPTYYPKRSPENGLIDWENDIYEIEKLIRAVTKPFDGAYTYLNDVKIKIWESQIFDINDFGYEFHKAGEIVEIFTDTKLLIKGFGGLLLVTKCESSVQLKKGDQLNTGGNSISEFQRNRFGFHDIP